MIPIFFRAANPGILSEHSRIRQIFMEKWQKVRVILKKTSSYPAKTHHARHIAT
jgi:hypothetical protein